MAWIARFSARSPPRLSRCRTVWPLLAGERAGAAQRGVCRAGQAGSDVIDDVQQLYPVVLELAPGLAEGERQAADLGLADGLLATGLSGQIPADERGQARPASRPVRAGCAQSARSGSRAGGRGGGR